MRHIQAIIICLLLAGISKGDDTQSSATSAHQAVSAKQYKILVRLVDATDSEADNVVRSYLRRELSKIEDVSLVTDDATHVDLAIACVAIHARDRSGQYRGYVLSFAVTDTLDELAAFIIIKDDPNLDKKTKELLASLLDNNGKLVDHFVITVSDEDLEATCQRQVAAIDGSDIEKVRKNLNAMRSQNASR